MLDLLVRDDSRLKLSGVEMAFHVACTCADISYLGGFQYDILCALLLALPKNVNATQEHAGLISYVNQGCEGYRLPLSSCVFSVDKMYELTNAMLSEILPLGLNNYKFPRYKGFKYLGKNKKN